MTDTVIVGAGVAGLAALRDLSRAGLDVCCLEARDRIGGRIHTVRDPFSHLPVEMGAEFVHGRPPEVFELSEVLLYELGGRQVVLDNGRPVEGAFDKTDRVMADIKASTADEPLESFLDNSAYSADEKRWTAAYVEGFNAARKERISVAALAHEAAAADQIDGDRLFRPSRGYDSVPLALVAGCESRVRLNCQVEAIQWRAGEARVRFRSLLDGSTTTLSAKRVLVTVPLGVVAARAIRFDPEPDHLLRAAGSLEVGHVVRVTLRFPRRFWPDDAGFLFSDEPVFPTWWTTLPFQSAVITAWSAGPKADPLEGGSKPEIIGQAIATLGRMLGTEPPPPENAWFHDWQADPFARGAYSYVPAGATQARRVLSTPIEDTLYFAGEATDTGGHAATVHGAIASGRRAARQILTA